MKLKVIEIKLQKLSMLTSKYFEVESIYGQIMEFEQNDNLRKISLKLIIETTNIPIVIFVRNGKNYLNTTPINVDGVNDIIMNLALDINYILNIQQLFLYKYFYENGYKKELKNLKINIIFID